jgi:hypothetical protein
VDFTTVRDLGGTGINVALRNAIGIKEKQLDQELTNCRKALAPTGGHADPTNDIVRFDGSPGPAEGVKYIDDAKR